jgi:predicted DNA binding CopG/RHH family protein
LPRKDEPRIQVRLSHTDLETLKSLADAANLSLGALIRECAMRYSGAWWRARCAMGAMEIRRRRP